MTIKSNIINKILLNSQTFVALISAMIVGIVLNHNSHPLISNELAQYLILPYTLIIITLIALSIPLIFFSIIHTFLTIDVLGASVIKLSFSIVINTIFAVIIGWVVVVLLHPGSGMQLPAQLSKTVISVQPLDSLTKLLVDIIIYPISIALALGIILRANKNKQFLKLKIEYSEIEHVVNLLLNTVKKILHWVIALVPIAVFGIVLKTVALQGFASFKSLGSFVIAVLLALALQAIYYLIRLRFGSWVSLQKFLQDVSAALIAAFSTASSTATMPIAFESLINKVGLRESSASLGILLGGNFNNDGTALYTVMSALFISQVTGQDLNLGQQLMVMSISIFASLIDVGIPGYASSATMIIVFRSVGLPTEYVVFFAAMDWFIDRCRTVINVMGNMTVSALIDGKCQEKREDTMN